MTYVTAGYEPQDVLQYFEDLSRIPRGSGNCAAVAQYVYEWGKALGLDAYKDEAHNVVLKKPGSKGCENLPPVMLQGHLDIVAVKLPESDHDFLKDPLPIYVDKENGRLRSKGTTLGADNGNACAYMMGVLARNDLVHPPIECVFTADEEIGLIGAEKLDKNAFTAKRMINMDAGGDQSVTCVSCAGGIELIMTQKPIWQEAKGNFISLFIHGLLGGHSAGINEGRASAAKLMARIINAVSLKTKVVVAEFYGGQKMNAIMADCKAVISVEDVDVALAIIEKLNKDIKEELRVTDAGYICDVAKIPAPEKMLDDGQSKRLVQFVLAVPNGVRDMSFEIENHVLNSNNLGAVWLTEDEIRVWTFNRSGDDSRQVAMAEEIAAIAEGFGFESKTGAYFFGWKYNPDSKMRALHTKLMKDMFDITLRMEAMHGGLETGVFYGKEPEMDIICMGPISGGAHTPDEWLDLESFANVFEYLCKFLEELTKE